MTNLAAKTETHNASKTKRGAYALPWLVWPYWDHPLF